MTQKIQVKRRATSTIPDDILTNNKLSWAARVVLGWMLGRSPEFDLRIWYVRKCFVLSDQQWVKIRKEMQGEGFFFQQKEQGGNGKFEWTNIVSDQPEFKPSPQNAGDGLPSHGKRGDKPIWSDTNLIDTTTPTTTKVVEIDDLVEAAVWTTRLTSEIKSEAGFRNRVRARIVSAGRPSNEDLLALKAWRAHQKRIADEQENAALHEQERKVADEHVAQQKARSLQASLQVEAYFESLDDDGRVMLIDHFTTHLAASKNYVVSQLYRKGGLESMVVRAEFFKFITNTIPSILNEEEMA